MTRCLVTDDRCSVVGVRGSEGPASRWRPAASGSLHLCSSLRSAWGRSIGRSRVLLFPRREAPLRDAPPASSRLLLLLVPTLRVGTQRSAAPRPPLLVAKLLLRDAPPASSCLLLLLVPTLPRGDGPSDAPASTSHPRREAPASRRRSRKHARPYAPAWGRSIGRSSVHRCYSCSSLLARPYAPAWGRSIGRSRVHHCYPSLLLVPTLSVGTIDRTLPRPPLLPLTAFSPNS